MIIINIWRTTFLPNHDCVNTVVTVSKTNTSVMQLTAAHISTIDFICLTMGVKSDVCLHKAI